MPLHIQTPLLESLALSRAAGTQVWLKLEALQPPGSFKLRGVGLACEHHRQRGAMRFVSSSGGNAGLAVAHAGRSLSVPVVVVVPQTTSARAIELLREADAEVIVHGSSWVEANALAQSMVEASDAFIHPFDDPLLWQGHASMIDEVAAAGLRPDAVVLSVGGGGLMSGVIEGLQRAGWDEVPVLAVETHGAASLQAAMAAGKPVAIEAITSIATSLGAKQVCDQAFALSQRHPVRPVQVSDAAAVRACRRFLDDHRLLVEPACGAALAVVYDALPALADFKRVLVIVCGGATATAEQLARWSAELPG
ncbi:pyridoxal-phosphate dependent enzyme [Denitromonas iodatirespirans]|uniref:L-serine ammonia-lyase n=1 Tax=Denitromonas iodatirespirans TaxID=2795389 RepID=A0A944DGR4_DENI1|nr:pyridoxal-phosphate dependent enzyme [Denitromonas iodatirespirans]MBT0962553.1 pyridoxal-phosphate dependent enzyme [Denitromonas iodatirespirans]